MARAAQIYEFTLATGASQVLLVEGGFYKLLSATGNIKVSREGGSAIGPLLPGQGERENFKRLTLQNTSGATNAISILVADNSFEDTRIYGSVNVVDGGLSRVLADRSFTMTSSVAALAGNYSHVQLWNPSPSGKFAAVTQITINPPSANSLISLRWGTVALSTLFTNPTNKRIAGASSNLEGRTEQNAAILGSGNVYYQVAMAAAESALNIRFSEPLWLQPGTGLMVVNNTVNIALGAHFDLFTADQP